MIAQMRRTSLASCLLVGLGLVLGACERPGTAASPDPTPTPLVLTDGEPEPSPSPSTGNVQPIITF